MTQVRNAVTGATPSILCVHPHGELYGSDRVFLQAVWAFRERWPDARISVLVPDGPLAAELRKKEPGLRITWFNVLRRAKLGKTIANMFRLPLDIATARGEIARHDITYISTVTALDYLLATRFSRKPSMVHLHELPVGKEAGIFRGLVALCRARFICISAAVRNAFHGADRDDMQIIWNGTTDLARTFTPVPHGDRLRLLLIGRFNAWKGQPLLIEAIARLTTEERERLSVRIVGSVYEGQDHFEAAIHEAVTHHDLGETIKVSGFVPDPSDHYDWADVVVVPSMKPEPFGLVAIEGMAAGRPIIGSGHGGLAEIVADRETGLHVTPGDVDSLVAAIRTYLADPALVGVHGQAARQRFEDEFRDDAFRRNLTDMADDMLRERRG